MVVVKLVAECKVKKLKITALASDKLVFQSLCLSLLLPPHGHTERSVFIF